MSIEDTHAAENYRCATSTGNPSMPDNYISDFSVMKSMYPSCQNYIHAQMLHEYDNQMRVNYMTYTWLQEASHVKGKLPQKSLCSVH